MNSFLTYFAIGALVFAAGCNVNGDEPPRESEPQERAVIAPAPNFDNYVGEVEFDSDYSFALNNNSEWLAFCAGYFTIRRDISEYPDEAKQWDAREEEAFRHIKAFRGYEPAIAVTRAGWKIWKTLAPEIPQERWRQLTEAYDEICGSTLSDLAPLRDAWLAEQAARK